MSYLVDTNVVSELRKGPRTDAHVAAWFSGIDPREIFLSVLTLGEIRRGIESLQRRDQSSALALNRWFHGLATGYESRILPVDARVADTWGRLLVEATIPAVDALLAATAKVHGLTLVTRNAKDVTRTGVACLNPFVRQ